MHFRDSFVPVGQAWGIPEVSKKAGAVPVSKDSPAVSVFSFCEFMVNRFRMRFLFRSILLRIEKRRCQRKVAEKLNPPVSNTSVPVLCPLLTRFVVILSSLFPFLSTNRRILL